MPTPILAHPHHGLHKPEHHQYFFTSGKTHAPVYQAVCLSTSCLKDKNKKITKQD
jgi:hypothetical protein